MTSWRILPLLVVLALLGCPSDKQSASTFATPPDSLWQHSKELAAWEAEQIALVPGIKRNGLELSITTTSGKTVSFKDDTTDGGNMVFHVYLGRDSRIGYDVVERRFYEGGDFLMVNTASGIQQPVASLPMVSPDLGRILTVSESAYEDVAYFTIWHIGRDSITKEFEDMELTPGEPKWAGNDAVEFLQDIWDGQSEPTKKAKGRLVYENKKWQLADSTILQVNKTLTDSADFTGDGVYERVLINIQGKSWRHPFKWVLTVYDGDKVILEHKVDDTWLDHNYADTAFVGGCFDYLHCKKSYYGYKIKSGLIEIADSSAGSELYSRNSSGSVYNVGREELIKKYHVSEEQASQIVDSMVARMKSGKVMVLITPISPVQSDSPKIYVPEVKGFVTIYES